MADSFLELVIVKAPTIKSDQFIDVMQNDHVKYVLNGHSRSNQRN